MKILILGSSGVHIVRWAEYFLKKGYEVVLVIGFEYQNDRMKIYKLGKKYGVFSFLSNLMKLKRIIKSEKPDVLYTQYLTTYGVMAAMSGFKNLALSIIGSDIYTHIKKFPFNFLAKRYINKFKMINVECEGVKTEVLKYYKYPDNVVVKNWGVDFNLFNPSIDRMEVRKLYNIGEDERVVVSGRVPIPRCNVETIVKAVNELNKNGKAVKLIVLGDGESMPKLKKMAEDFGIFDKVIFTGFIPHNEFGKYLKAADVYVQTLLVDTVGIAMLDAMACKIPCISSDVSCNREFLQHEKNGFLLSDPMDYSQLAKYIIELLDNKELAGRFVDESYQMILKECDENKNMEYIENEMKRLVLS